MNIFKSAAFSFVLLASLASAKVSVEVALVDSSEASVAQRKMLTLIPAMTLEVNESKVEFVSDVRLQATLKESHVIQFDIAFQDEVGNYVTIAQPDLLVTASEIPSEITFTNQKGEQLVVIVHVIDMQ